MQSESNYSTDQKSDSAASARPADLDMSLPAASLKRERTTSTRFRLILSGNRALTESRLASELKIVNWTGEAHLAHLAQKQVLQIYQNHGFLQASVDEAAIIPGDPVEVHLQIDEGDQFRYGRAQFTGSTLFTAEQLRSILGIRPGDRADLRLLRAGEQRLRQIYLNRGFPSAEIRLDSALDHGARMLNFTVSIEENPLP